MLPIRLTLRLTYGSVTLRAWGANVVEGYTTDLLTLTATFGAMREELREGWQDFRRGDVEKPVWAAYWRLIHASLDNCTLPEQVTWNDRLTLLDALWELNMLEEAEGKWEALTQRAQRMLDRLSQGHLTAPSMSS